MTIVHAVCFGLQFGFDDIASKRGNEHVVALPETGPSGADAPGTSGPRSNAIQTHANEPFAQRLASETNSNPKHTGTSTREPAGMLTNRRQTSIISGKFADMERHGYQDERSENRNRDFD